MRHAFLIAALLGAALSAAGGASAQDWGGAAGVAAARGYTASTGFHRASQDDAEAARAFEPPAAAEAAPRPDASARIARARPARHGRRRARPA